MSDTIYKAKSLEDIAAMFRTMADRALERVKFASTQKEIQIIRCEAATWRQAAHVLRHTQLEGDHEHPR